MDSVELQRNHDGDSEINTFVSTSIEAMRKKLLDLTSRNRLLNFPITSKGSSLRIVDELPDQLFSALVTEQAMQFAPVPEPTRDELIALGYLAIGPDKKENKLKPYPSAKDWAGHLGIKNDFDLPRNDDTQQQFESTAELLRSAWDFIAQYAQEHDQRLTGIRSHYTKQGIDIQELTSACRKVGYQGLDEFERHVKEGKTLNVVTANPAHEDTCIQVMMYPSELESYLRTIHNKAQTALEESGAGILYLGLGFLEWFESDDSKKSRLAPLFTIPVRLERGKLDPQDGLYKYHVVYTGEDIIPNLSLREKLHTDFGLALPDFDEEQTPEAYLARVSDIICRNKPRWSVCRYGALCLLNFSKMMMYLDLDPTRWPKGSGNIMAHPVLTRFFTSQNHDHNREQEYIESEYCIDEIPEIHDLVPLIDDADSSQHSALIDAIRGKDLVIEGPPGTGKSQTITNLIAAALLNGKKVLFVAEKMAALDVVKHRLNKAGLGAFCLELHSHKSHKRKVLDDIQDRLLLDAKMPSVQDIDAQIARYEELKIHLNDYVALINRTWGATGQTLHQILSGATRYRKHLEIDATRLHIDGLSGMKLDKISQLQLRDQIKAFSDIYHEVRQQIGSDSEIYDHPWSGVNNTDIQLFDSQRIVDSLQSWQITLQRFQDELIKTLADLEVDAQDVRTLSQASSMIRDLAALPPLDGGELFQALPALATEEALSAVRDYVTAFNAAQEGLQELAVELRPEQMVQIEQDASLSLPYSLLEHTGVDINTSLSEVCQWVVSLCRVTDTLTAISEQLEDLKVALPASIATHVTTDARGIAFTAQFLDLMSGVPVDLLRLRDPLFDDDEMDAVLADMANQLDSLRPLHEKLSSVFQLERLPELPILSDIIKKLTNSGFFSWFNSQWRAARDTLRSLAVVPNSKFADLMQLAPSLLEFAALNLRFVQSGFDKRLDGAFRGISTEVDQLLRLRIWYKQVRETYGVGFGPMVGVGSAVLGLDASLIKGIQQLEKNDLSVTLTRLQSEVKILLAKMPSLVSRYRTDGQSWIGQNGLLPLVIDDLQTTLSQLQAWFQSDHISLQRIMSLTKKLDEIRVLRQQLDSSTDAIAMFVDAAPLTLKLGCSYENRKSQGIIDTTLVFATHLTRELSSQALADYIRHMPNSDAYLTLKDKGECLQQLWKEQTDRFSAFSTETNLDRQMWLKSTDSSLEQVLVRNQRAIEQPRWLNGWVNFTRNQDQMRDKGLKRIWDSVLSGVLAIEKVDEALSLAIYDQLSREILSSHPELARISGNEHNARQKLFREYDKKLIQLQRQRIAAQIALRHIPAGNAGGRKSEYTELALIKNELGKKTRHIPIRQLVNRAGYALLALKPCFMMGPMSAAHYLEPGRMEFDLVVMDEASQVKPEDALGVIARGKQLIVVGDPKQLPPTSFFDRAMDDEDDEDVAAVNQTDSILDAALPLFPMRRLRWHYRSQHEKLIAYSNRHFYSNDLVIFPSPHANSSEFGIKFSYVPHGRFSNQHNIEEAEVIATAVINQAIAHPDESLGIVAMSSKQRDQIERALDEECRKSKEAELAVERLTTMQDPLFIKNLENVQGDERDVIFISFTYGPAEVGGKVYQRFGPINADVGWRRLNVLFTRSKKRMHVFSSMRSDDVLTSENSKRGVVALKGFLQFAEKGYLDAQTIHTGKGPDSDFEVAVMDALREAGFACEPQVGVAGFFIDLAVIDPGAPGKYLMGIECDGAAYHSAKSARDRDRLRQEVLERLGWNIRRIWSTDWFSNPDEVLAPIIRELNEKRTPATEMSLVMPTEQPSDSMEELESCEFDMPLEIKELGLKEQLRHLAKHIIAKAFPDVDDDRRLLRPAMLEALLEHQPISRSEFVERIPKYLREATDPHEAQHFLDRVLSLIDGVDDGEGLLVSESELS